MTTKARSTLVDTMIGHWDRKSTPSETRDRQRAPLQQRPNVTSGERPSASHPKSVGGLKTLARYSSSSSTTGSPNVCVARCFRGHPLKILRIVADSKVCTLCRSTSGDGDIVQICQACPDFSFCNNCSPSEACLGVQPLFPTDRSIFISSFSSGGASDVAERLGLFVESMVKNGSVHSVALRADLARAWVVLDSPASLKRFTDLQSGDMDLMDNSTATWEPYIPPRTRFVYQMSIPDQLRAHPDLLLIVRRSVSDGLNLMSTDIDSVILTSEADSVNLVFTKGELDMTGLFDGSRVVFLSLPGAPSELLHEVQLTRTMAKVFSRPASSMNKQDPRSMRRAENTPSVLVQNFNGEAQPNLHSSRASISPLATSTPTQRTQQHLEAPTLRAIQPNLSALGETPTCKNTISGKFTPRTSVSNSSAPSTLHVEECVPKSCVVCMDDKYERDFPKALNFKAASSIVSSHKSVCTSCMAQSLTVKIKDNVRLGDLSCPCGCGGILQYAAVRQILSKTTPRVFDEYLKRIEELATVSIPDFKWCSNNNCGSGQSVPASDLDSRGVWTCRSCGSRTCGRHQLPAAPRNLVMNPTGGTLQVRKGAVCCSGAFEDSDYTERMSESWIEENSKPCPKCKAPINKDGGCRHMTCSKCTHEFFWCCLRNYRDPVAARKHRQECPD